MSVGAEHPLAIGCVGGSGSRVIARIVQSIGYHLGDDLNGPLDNLWFTLLFKRPSVLIDSDATISYLYENFRHRMIHGRIASAAFDEVLRRLCAHDRPPHSAAWLEARRETFLRERPGRAERIAWKEPNTHLVIDRLLKTDPALRYIHLTRNGLDMAFSSNLNQLRLWGPVVLDRAIDPGPRDALAYWVAVETRIRELAVSFPGRMLILSYEALLSRPDEVIAEICRFCGHAPPADLPALIDSVRPPASLGRHTAQDLHLLAPEDVETARAIAADHREGRGSSAAGNAPAPAGAAC